MDDIIRSNANLHNNKLGLVEWYQPQPLSEPALAQDSSTSVPATATASRKRRGTMPQESQQQPRAFFGKAQQHYELYSGDKSTRFMAWMSPHVDRGFFMAGEDWTCYRRNYFQVSCTFSLVGADPTSGGTSALSASTGTGCVAVVNGVLRRVTRFLIGLSAHVMEDGKVVELVQHTPKRDKGPQMTPQPQPALPTDAAARRGPAGSNTACFERIQFKTATANNGKRRAAQQYYTLEVLLLADCDDGGRILAATSTSAPIVVRGRSPGHYTNATMHHRTASSTDAHQPPQQMSMQQDDSSNPTAVAAAIAAAAGYDFSANSMVQALSRIGAPAPHPQEILDRAQNMSAAASLPGLQPSRSRILNPAPPAAMPADLSFITATMAGSTGGTGSPHARLLDMHPPPASTDPNPDISLL
ncbi:hypothetical protein H4R20_001776 [Coemansia guatemalensis]|uniref:NDT80 domain-containing protein n=1 Tax=Coemansia guatemalensis TaxID=2761395 RepID=A0A9W8HWT3_9FUNG|nr:hypothetical protein H4R20_001776 [Coemansia guatemalensis]